MNLQDITSLITKAASQIEANESFALPVLAAKARREAESRPTDVPLVNASNVLTKMASDKMFISRSELSSLVERMSASHSKLSKVFAEELGNRPEPKPNTFTRSANEGKPLEFEFQKLADPVLANALAGAFEAKPIEKIYSNEDAQKAQRAAYAQLLGIGCSPVDIKTFAGRKDIIICQAIHETPKGQANVLIPVELIEGKATLPQLFFTPNGFSDLDKEAYENNITNIAGKNFKVDGSKLLDVLEQVKKGESSLVNEVEMAAIKLASEQGIPASDPNAIYYAEMIDSKDNVELPKMPETEESKFAESLGKPEGVAKFIHSAKVVDSGRAIISRKFAELGYKNVQIKVSEVDQDKIYYAVAVGTGTGFEVPIEIEAGLVKEPKVIFSEGNVTAFTKEAILDVIKSGFGGNKRALASASSCSSMKPTDLLEIVKASVHEGNYTRAEEAINVLADIDETAHKVALAHFMSNIYEPGKSPSEDIAEQRKSVEKQTIQNITPQFMAHKIFFPEGA